MARTITFFGATNQTLARVVVPIGFASPRAFPPNQWRVFGAENHLLATDFTDYTDLINGQVNELIHIIYPDTDQAVVQICVISEISGENCIRKARGPYPAGFSQTGRILFL
jgi:hypothetical protein